MVKPTFALLLLFSLIPLIFTNAEADWVDPEVLDLPFVPNSFFAGYLETNNNRRFFYSYHPSQHNSRKDPVVIWFGSGPGCSGLYSMFYSKGPFIFTRNTQKWQPNNFAWNKRANVVFIESPGTVGFSIGDANVTDVQTANDHLYALISFFTKFVGLKDQDLYLAGEGYAGIYVTYLAQRITQHNNDPLTLPDQHILLKGIFLGNPCTTPEECSLNVQSKHFFYTPDDSNRYSYEFLTNHYFYSSKEYEQYRACRGNYTAECNKTRDEMDRKFRATGVDRRNIFAECLEQNTGDYPNIPCLDQIGVLNYLNQPHIREALHTNISKDTKWIICNSDVGKNYQRDPRGSYHLYPSLLRNYRVTIYSGALDANNPISATTAWIQQLREQRGFATTKQWTAWEMNGVNGGEVWKVNDRLTFVSVRSAGHMVFTDQQQLGFYIYDSFLNNTM